MGYIRHHLTVWQAIDYPPGRAAEIEAQVNELRGRLRPEMARLVVGPIVSAINGDITYALFPDGSKEGWSTSYEGEELRAAFTVLAPYRALHLAWGDDEPTVYEGEFQPMEDVTESPLDWHGRPWKAGGRADDVAEGR